MRLVAAAPPPALPTVEAARLLNVQSRQVTKLLVSRFLPSTRLADVAAVCASPVMQADPGERQPVLRQAVRKPGGPEDVGINAQMTLDEVADQCLGWWITNPHHWLAAKLVPVTIAGFCVAVLTIDDIAERTEGPPVRYAFRGRCAGLLPDLTQPGSAHLDPSLVQSEQIRVTAMLGARAPGRSGGPTAYLDVR